MHLNKYLYYYYEYSKKVLEGQRLNKFICKLIIRHRRDSSSLFSLRSNLVLLPGKDHAAESALARVFTFVVYRRRVDRGERRGERERERENTHGSLSSRNDPSRIVMRSRGRLAHSSALYFHRECVTSFLGDLVARIELVAKCARPFETCPVRKVGARNRRSSSTHTGRAPDFEPVGRRD